MPQSNPPPSLPQVFDEAGTSPRWLPVLGIGLLVLLAALVASRMLGYGIHRAQPPAAPDAGNAVQVSATFAQPHA